jgi:hypothetical protein
MIVGPLLIASGLMLQRPVPSHVGARRWYAQGTLSWSHHPPAREMYHRLDRNLQGRAWSFGVEGGGFLNSSIALEGEFLYGGWVTAPQHFGYTFSEDYIEGNRDLLFNELVRFRADRRGRVELLAGAGYARVANRETSIVGYGFDQIRRPEQDRRFTRHAFTWTSGVDFVLPLSDHAAIAPGLRLRWVRRLSAQEGANGIGPVSLEVGAGIRVR